MKDIHALVYVDMYIGFNQVNCEKSSNEKVSKMMYK